VHVSNENRLTNDFFTVNLICFYCLLEHWNYLNWAQSEFCAHFVTFSAHFVTISSPLCWPWNAKWAPQRPPKSGSRGRSSSLKSPRGQRATRGGKCKRNASEMLATTVSSGSFGCANEWPAVFVQKVAGRLSHTTTTTTTTADNCYTRTLDTGPCKLAAPKRLNRRLASASSSAKCQLALAQLGPYDAHNHQQLDPLAQPPSCLFRRRRSPLPVWGNLERVSAAA